MIRFAIGVLIFVATLALIMIRPYRVTEWMAAIGGAVLLLIGGYIGPVQAYHVLLGQWNVYGVFLGLMTISALADEAGIFETLARLAARWAAGNALRLYVGVFAIGVVITTFLSNDATALILTPVVYALVTRLRLPVLPFMFACTFIADTASYVLPVSNPINILVTDAYGGSLFTFVRYLFVPVVFCIGFNMAAFIWLFRRDLRLSYDLDVLVKPDVDLRLFRFTAIGLVCIALGYVIASALQVPLSFIALGGSLLLLAISFWRRHLDIRRISHEISWSIFGFISGMFIVVQAVENLGLTALFGRALVRIGGGTPLGTVLVTTFGTAIGANLINNVPMALVMISTLRGIHVAPATMHALPYATMFGADLGPNLTTVGSLATILWLLILRRKGLDISTFDYFKLGITVVPIMLAVGGFLIWLGI